MNDKNPADEAEQNPAHDPDMDQDAERNAIEGMPDREGNATREDDAYPETHGIAELAHLAEESRRIERAGFPKQKVRIRAEPGSTRLGLVVERFDGGAECEEMQPRTTYERELYAGDQVHVITLAGRDRDSFMRSAGIEPEPLTADAAAQQDGE